MALLRSGLYVRVIAQSVGELFLLGSTSGDTNWLRMLSNRTICCWIEGVRQCTSVSAPRLEETYANKTMLLLEPPENSLRLLGVGCQREGKPQCTLSGCCRGAMALFFPRPRTTMTPRPQDAVLSAFTCCAATTIATRNPLFSSESPETIDRGEDVLDHSEDTSAESTSNEKSWHRFAVSIACVGTRQL